MNTIMTFVQNLRSARILAVLLAGILLLSSTACSGSSIAKTVLPDDTTSPTSSVYKRDENMDKMIKGSYKIEPSQGGMNNHLDTDRRQNTSAAEAKAKNLVNQAQKNIEPGPRNANKVVKNLQDNVSLDKVQDTLGDIKDNVGESAQQIKEGTQKGIKNLKNNLDSAVDKVSDNVQQVIK